MGDPRRRFIAALFLGLAWGGHHELAGQDALVLSTGGSRGFVHAGALMALEERGFDPGVVVGNSMGAVIGALYAAGYTAPEIWNLVATTDWSDVFMPEPIVVGPSRAVHFPMVRLAVGHRPLELHRGFIPDWRVNRLLVRLLFAPQAASRGDFDRLARRYRAVTVDLATGERVVLGSGDLARAVRASMATPGFFSPVQWGETLLADGGIVDYLPVSVARELGARFVVAVDISTPPDTLAGLDPVALGGRAVALLMVNAAPHGPPPDVLVRPPLDPGFSGARFPGDVTPLLRLGREAALDALPDRTGGGIEPRPMPAPPSRLDTLVVEAANPSLEAMGRRAFSSLVPGRFDADAILQRVDGLYASGIFGGVWPRLEPGVDGDARGGDRLAVRLEAAPALSLSGAAGYDNDRGGRVWGALQRLTSLGTLPTELTAAAATDGVSMWASLGSRLHVGRGPLALTGGLHYREMDERIFDDDMEVSGEREIQRMGGWAGLEMRQAFPDRVLTAVVHAEAVDVEGGASGPSVGPRVTLTRASPPSRVVGVPTELILGARIGGVDYVEARARASRELPLPLTRAAAVLDAQLTSAGAPADVRLALGDDGGLPGHRWGVERGRARLLAGADLAWPLPLEGFVRLRARVGAAPLELDDLAESGAWAVGAALEGFWPTPLGLVVIGFGVNGRGEHRVDVGLGPPM
ncbi:MAG: patatin-like phospholipase family protein [Gemmatimonadetes bacterium]|nr:patatin-like phospholipase family protein [Gemmatimonadota bacterium]